MPAVAVVALSHFVAGLIFSQFGNAFRRTIAAVGVAGCDQLLSGRVVAFQAFGLEVGAEIAADPGPSSQSMPSHSRPFRMLSTAPSVIRLWSVSSTLTTKFPPLLRAKAS